MWWLQSSKGYRMQASVSIEVVEARLVSLREELEKVQAELEMT